MEVPTVETDLADLQRELADLREKVARLRQSRRVLMAMLAHEMHEGQARLQRLECENRRLRRLNTRMMRALWQQAAGREPGRRAEP
jgi:predicted nuclease with TOPRIM domain